MTAIRVTNCDDCPACNSDYEHGEQCNLTSEEPESHAVPQWCPLRQDEVTLYLDEREVVEPPPVIHKPIPEPLAPSIGEQVQSKVFPYYHDGLFDYSVDHETGQVMRPAIAPPPMPEPPDMEPK
jgi:hypothetical protein